MPERRLTRPTASLILDQTLSDEILYGRSDEHLRIFVSARMSGNPLRRERRTAVSVIDGQPWHKSWSWERDARAGPYSSRVVCIKNASTSDALVLIIGDELSAITKAEYFAAKRAGIPRFIFVKSNVVQSPATQRFIERERGGAVYLRFQNLPEFKTQLVRALRSYGLRAHRITIVRSRGTSR